jgi:hypothetical protein
MLQSLGKCDGGSGLNDVKVYAAQADAFMALSLQRPSDEGLDDKC